MRCWLQHAFWISNSGYYPLGRCPSAAPGRCSPRPSYRGIRGPVCAVEVMIRRNKTYGTGSFKLSVEWPEQHCTRLEAISGVVAPAVGENSVLRSELGCDGGILQPRSDLQPEALGANQRAGNVCVARRGAEPILLGDRCQRWPRLHLQGLCVPSVRGDSPASRRAVVRQALEAGKPSETNPSTRLTASSIEHLHSIASPPAGQPRTCLHLAPESL